MNKYLLESIIGCSTSLYLSNIYRRISQEKRLNIIEKNCSIIELKNISINCDEVIIIAYLNNSGIFHSSKVKNKNLTDSLFLNIFSCKSTLELNLFLIKDDKIMLFKTSTYACLIKNENSISLFKDDTFYYNDYNSVEVTFDFFSLKKLHLLNNLPYTRERRVENVFISLEGKRVNSNLNCILCFYRSNDIIGLILHMKMCHLIYKISVNNENRILFEEKDLKLTNQNKPRKIKARRINTTDDEEYSKVFIKSFLKSKINEIKDQINDSKEITIILQEKKTVYTFHSSTFFFINKIRKISQEKEFTFPYEYFQEETFAPLNTLVIKDDWVKFYILNQIEEIIDLSANHISLINKWNLFIFHKRVNRSNIIQFISEFIYNEGPSFELFEILTTMKKNCIISEDELREILRKYLL